jgi:hypothetical protein
MTRTQYTPGKGFDVEAYCHYVEYVLIPDAINKLTGWPKRIIFFASPFGLLIERRSTR